MDRDSVWIDSLFRHWGPSEENSPKFQNPSSAQCLVTPGWTLDAMTPSRQEAGFLFRLPCSFPVAPGVHWSVRGRNFSLSDFPPGCLNDSLYLFQSYLFPIWVYKQWRWKIPWLQWCAILVIDPKKHIGCVYRLIDQSSLISACVASARIFLDRWCQFDELLVAVVHLPNES